MKIIGYQHSNFTVKDTGAKISGYILYLSEARDGVTGVATERIFLSNNRIGNYVPNLNDNIRIYWNKYGKVDSIDLIK